MEMFWASILNRTLVRYSSPTKIECDVNAITDEINRSYSVNTAYYFKLQSF